MSGFVCLLAVTFNSVAVAQSVRATDPSSAERTLGVTVQDAFGYLIPDAEVTYYAIGGAPRTARPRDNGTCSIDVTGGDAITLEIAHPDYGAVIAEMIAPDYAANVLIHWDGAQARTKVVRALAITPPPQRFLVGGGDDCAAAEFIAGVGSINFDLTAATSDGLDHALCDTGSGPSIENDVWWAWIPPADGAYTIDTCGSTFDTKLAVYVSTGVCPPTDADLVACNDDFCGTASSVTVPISANFLYLIRIGTPPGVTGGVGPLNIAAIPTTPVTCSTGVGCQFPDQLGHGSNSTFAAFSDLNPGLGVAITDSFRATADGDITSLCWWGIYFDFAMGGDCSPGLGDSFSVTYFADNGTTTGPGAVIAGPIPLTLSNKFATTNMLVLGSSFLEEYQFEASHTAVPVSANTNYWIQITNNSPRGDCGWAWSTAPAGDNRAIQTASGQDVLIDVDFAFCLDVATDPAGLGPIPGPPNDFCTNATQISGEGIFPFDNEFATEDGLNHFVCDFFGFQAMPRDVWYCWTAPCDGIAFLETCGITSVDTKIAAYDGCICLPTDTELLQCNDDACGFQSAISFPVVAGNQYTFRIGTFIGSPGGQGSFSIQCVNFPPNDLCEDAIPVAVPSVTTGSSLLSAVDANAPTCGTPVTSPGVWYTVMGTGNTMTASTCNNTDFRNKVNIYCGDCPIGFTCVAGDQANCGPTGIQAEVSWCSQVGANYYVLIHGFGGSAGDFELTITDDGIPCTSTVQCVPEGACCIDGDCFIMTNADCVAAGGKYIGDGTHCGGSGIYVPATCNNSLEDITATGNPLTLGDDAGQVVPLGFTFNFFGNDYADVAVCSNGYLTFGTIFDALFNAPLPNPADVNDLIAPLWDNFDPTSGGTVHYETLGTAPDRRFVAQWTDVPQFGSADMNTFQAVLFETSNAIEFRYGSFTPQGFLGDYTIGIEDQLGAVALPVDPQTVIPGDCLSFTPTDIPNPCPHPLQADIRLGKCPNRVYKNSDGLIATAIVGDGIFDLSTVDFASIQISRSDGVGGSLSPYEGANGETALVDLARPFAAPPSCQVTDPDGINDIFVFFSAPELIQALQLDTVPDDSLLRLVITGTRADGRIFRATDLVVVLPPLPGNGMLTVNSNAPVRIHAEPQDDLDETDGVAQFSRSYPLGTQVTLTAPGFDQGRPFAGWMVNGRRQGFEPTLTITLDAPVVVDAVYHDFGRTKLR